MDTNEKTLAEKLQNKSRNKKAIDAPVILDLMQIYTKGNAKRKEIELIFVNHQAQSFFMRSEAFIDLLNHLEEVRLVKKYNKKKKAGYIGGEVLGCIHQEAEENYKLVLAFGPQDQIIDSKTKILDHHEYHLSKEDIELYQEVITKEEEEAESFLILLKEADHNIQKRFNISEVTIDLKECLQK